MPEQRVSELMREVGTAAVAPDTPLRDAAEILLTSDHPLLIIADNSNSFLGVVSEAAVVRLLLTTSCESATLQPIISRHVESASVNATLSSVMPLFRSNCHTVVPVVDSKRRIIGLLHRRDVVRTLLNDVPAEKPSSTSKEKNSQENSSIPDPHFGRRSPQTEQSAEPYRAERPRDDTDSRDYPT